MLCRHDQITPAGAVIRKAELERAALLFSEIPGVTSRLALSRGTQPGTSAPEVELQPGKRVAGYAGLDNQGDATTGRSRVMAGLYASNLAGRGDRLRLDVLDAYESSNLINGAIDYSLLAGGYGTRLGVSYSHLNYRYSLNQLGFNGYANNWGLYLTQPWIRTVQVRTDVRLDIGQQYLTDSYPPLFAPPGTDNSGRKRVNLGMLSVTGSVAGLPGGLTRFALSAAAGDISLRNQTARFWSRNGGQFLRVNYLLNHSQQLRGPFYVYASVSGQRAGGSLDSSQKFLAGGPAAVRAYDTGDGSMDQGTVLTAELRGHWDLPLRWLAASPQLTLAAFYDQAWGEQYRNNHDAAGRPLTTNNRVNLSGTGLYATLAGAGSYALTLTWAHRTGHADPNAVRRDRDRIWVSAVKTF